MTKFVLPLALLVLPACADNGPSDPSPDCYPEYQPDPDAPVEPFALPCGRQLGDPKPSSPDGLEGQGPYSFLYCGPSDAGVCPACPAAEVTEDLRPVMMEQMAKSTCPVEDQVINAIEPMCVTTREHETQPCCYAVWYWSPCDF